MDENLHDIDELFKEPIEEHEEMPSARVWDAIDANLDKSNIVSIKKKYNNLKKIAVALLLLLLGAVVYEIQTAKTGDKNTAANTERKDHTNGNPSTNNTSAAHSEKNKNTQPENQDLSWSDSLSNNFTTINALKNTDEKTSTSQDKNFINTGKEKTGGDDIVVGVNEVGKVNKVNKVDRVNKVDKVNGGDVTVKVNRVNKVIKGDKGNRGVNVAEQDAQTADASTAVNTKGKTKISVQNGTAALPDDVLEQQGNYNIENATAAELMQLGNTGVERLVATSWDNSRLKQITAVRVSPDARLKNRIRMPKQFQLGITPFVSTQFSFNRIEDDHHDPGPQPRNNREQIKKEEQHHSASSFGVLVDIPLGKKWGLQSGISYVSQATTMEPKKIFAKMDTDGKVKYRFDCSSGYTYISLKTGTAATPVVGDSVVAAASTNTLKYIGVPLALTYTVSLGKFNMVPTFGTVANFLAKQQIETEITQPGSSEKQTINSIKGLKSTYFNLFSGISFEYNLNKKIAFSVIPSGNFALSSINKDAAVKSYPNSFALTGGVKIKF